MTLINYALDNGLFFYAGFSTVGIAIGYSFVSSLINSYKIETVEKGVQTDAWDDFSDRPSLINQASSTSIDTETPNYSPVEFLNTEVQVNLDTVETGTQTITESVSTATTMLPVPPMNIEMIPNPDLTNTIIKAITYTADYADRSEMIAHMLGGF